MKKLTCLMAVAFLAMGLVFAPTAAQAADKVVIGVPTSLNFLEGKESYNAVKLAVDEINAKGGVKVGGKMLPFTIEAIDIRDAARGVPVPDALLGIEKLILEKKPHALVVGPFRSEALLAGMDMLAKHKMPLLGTIAMSPGTEAKVMKDPKYKYVFRVSLNAKYFGMYIGGMMSLLHKKFGFNKVFIMNQDVAWARATAKGSIKAFKNKLKWQVVGHETFPTGATDFAPALMKAKMAGAQVIMPIFDMPQSGILIKQWKAMKVPAIMAGFISPMAGGGAWKTFNGKIGGVLNAVFELGSVPSAKYPPATKFYNAYVAKYGKPMEAGHGPAPSYASVYLLKAAIEKANSLDPDAIVAVLRATDTPGVMGHIKFSKGNQVIYGMDPQKKALGCFVQWSEKGKRVIVFPPAIAEGDIKLPSWIKSAK